jgi:hypothetical protein
MKKIYFFNFAIASILIGLLSSCLIFIDWSNKQALDSSQLAIEKFCDNKPVQITNIYSFNKQTCLVVKYNDKEIIVSLNQPQPIHVGDYWYLKATTSGIVLDKKVEQ